MALGDFLTGLRAHASGMRLAFKKPSYLLMALFPFALTILFYVGGYFIVSHYSDQILAYFWSPGDAAQDSIWIYINKAVSILIKAVLYVIVFAFMYYFFMVITNIIASPLYDYLAGKVIMDVDPQHRQPQEVSIIRIILEELKKAIFVLLIPALLFFIPIIGGILSLVVGMFLIAWDFVDFSLSRDQPVFSARLKYLLRHPLLMLGFGCLLMIPVLNLVLYPLAILGASTMYARSSIKDRAKARPSSSAASTA